MAVPSILKANLEQDLKEAEDKIITDDEFKEKARKYTVNKKLDKFTDNYMYYIKNLVKKKQINQNK